MTDLAGKTVTGGRLNVGEFLNGVGPSPDQPPPAPSNLTAVPAVSPEIDLAWTHNASTETGFRVERCKGSKCTNFAQIVTLGRDITTYRDTVPTRKRIYRYRVRAFNAAGNSAYSNIAKVRAK
jgi:hypothetical protein